MIIIVHQHKKVIRILDANKQVLPNITLGKSITNTIGYVANLHPESLIILLKHGLSQ